MASRESQSVGNGPDEDELTGFLRASGRRLVGVANEDPITRLGKVRVCVFLNDTRLSALFFIENRIGNVVQDKCCNSLF